MYEPASAGTGQGTNPAATLGRSYQMSSDAPPRAEPETKRTPNLMSQNLDFEPPFNLRPAEQEQEPEPIVKEPHKPVNTIFNKNAVRNAELYLDKPLVYKVKTDMDEIEMKCDLCLEFTCCPEHCCDVSITLIN